MSNTLHCTSIRIKTQEVVGSFLMQYGCGCQQQHPSRRRADLLIHWCGRNPRAVATGWLALAWVWACLGRSRFKALADQHGHYEPPPHNDLLEWVFWCIHFASFCITGSCVIRILWEGVGSGPWPSCQVSLMPTELLVSNFGMCFWRTGSPRLSILIWSRSNRSFFAEFHHSSFAAGQRVGSGLFHLDMCSVHGHWKRQRHLLSDGSEMFRAWRGWPSTFGRQTLPNSPNSGWIRTVTSSWATFIVAAYLQPHIRHEQINVFGASRRTASRPHDMRKANKVMWRQSMYDYKILHI